MDRVKVWADENSGVTRLTMIVPFLEISFRHGRAFAAYIHCALPTAAATTTAFGPGLLIDQDADGSIIGLEITDPQRADRQVISDVLARHGVSMSPADLAPLAA